MSQQWQPRREFFDKNNMTQEDRLPYPEYRYTKYFWLINLNRSAYSRDQAHYLMQLLRKAVLNVFARGDVVAFAHPNHQFNNIYIGENQLQLCVEVGPKKGKVHIHMIQSLKHRSMLNIDPEDVKEKIGEELRELTGGRLEHVFVSKKSHPSEKPLLEYIDKTNTYWKERGQQVQDIWTYSLVNGGRGGGWSIRQSREDEIATASDIPNDLFLDAILAE